MSISKKFLKYNFYSGSDLYVLNQELEIFTSLVFYIDIWVSRLSKSTHSVCSRPRMYMCKLYL